MDDREREEDEDFSTSAAEDLAEYGPEERFTFTAKNMFEFKNSSSSGLALSGGKQHPALQIRDDLPPVSPAPSSSQSHSQARASALAFWKASAAAHYHQQQARSASTGRCYPKQSREDEYDEDSY
jgi:hypothetical protein